jgi:glutamate synthase domain-containing protein 3
MSALRETATILDLRELGRRATNRALQHARSGDVFAVTQPDGLHAIAAGLRSDVNGEIRGHAGYYCAGMNQRATVRVHGNVGVGVAENMMSGRVEVSGSAGQAAAATAHGGLLVIQGNAAARCAISLKGGDVVVGGSVGLGFSLRHRTGES